MEYTKAGMLEYLKKHLKNIHIQPIYILNSKAYFIDKSSEISKIIAFSKNKNLIIRSSSKSEDTSVYSNAGKFETLLNINPTPKQIQEAVEKVYASYNTDEEEEILIQPMLSNICKSGVIFTADIDTFSDYYSVNYFEGTDTTAVTGGNSNHLKTFVAYKDTFQSINDTDMRNLIEICQEIESLLVNPALDIEFAIDTNHKIHILQVRPIAYGQKQMPPVSNLTPALNRIYKKITKLSTRHPFLLGETTSFGVMPDWNPAEILGIRPKKLSISLYKELITDHIWAHQRFDYGYRDLTMHPLMISFCGIPYIDTRITFNSFIPQNLNDTIAEKLVNYYQKKLSEYPAYHDKIEFEIVYSCYYLGLHEKLKELWQYGFNDKEITRIEFSLLNLTNTIINPKTGLYKRDIEKIETLEKNYNKILGSDISLVDKIYWLIEECKTYGTLPFAGVARAGFIAMQFLHSFISTGIITESEYHRYMNSLDTINKQMNTDLCAYRNGKISETDFLSKYGHIRPGTYDILSKRYDEAFSEYFKGSAASCTQEIEKDYNFSQEVMQKIQFELDQNGLIISANDLICFIRESIEGREYLKFIFTRSVSKILQLIEELGKRLDITKDDLSFLDISVIKQLYVDLYSGDIKMILNENIKNNKEQYNCALQLKLPSLIIHPQDIYSYYLLNEEPNFITQKNTSSEIIVITDSSQDAEGKIAFIQSADPGYDYLFTKNISGLVTQFGGANSHMAIRCAELGIPAIIGVGEKNFNEWKKHTSITIDCQKRQVTYIE